MTTTLTSGTHTVDLATYAAGNPFYAAVGTTIIATTGDGIYGDRRQAWTLTNAGTISGGSNGVVFEAGGTITNQGLHAEIAGAKYGVLCASGSGSVANAGTIEATVYYGVGIRLQDGGTIVNQGETSRISGLNVGVSISGAPGVISNEGVITGETAIRFSTSGTIVNAGEIETISGSGVAIFMSAGGAVTNLAGGRIQGSTGIGIENGTGVVTNAGTILQVGDSGPNYEGVYLSEGGTVTNLGTSALISTINAAVEIDGAAGTVTNAGTITSSRYIGIYLLGGGDVTNLGTASRIVAEASGVSDGIGAVTNFGTILSAEVIGVTVAGTVTNFGDIAGNLDGVRDVGESVFVRNSGTISAHGGVGVEIHNSGAATVVNAGTIIGSSTALEFAYGDDVLIIDPGAVFVGAVEGGLVDNTLDLAMGAKAGVLRGLGSQYADFQTINIEAGASWTLTGITDVAIGDTVTDHGVLAFTGTVINDGTIRATDAAGIGVDFVGAGAETLVNAGRISGGAAGEAVKFGSGNDLLILDPGALFVGRVDGGAGDNRMELAAGSTSATLDGFGTMLTNFGSITVDSGGYWTLAGTSIVGPHVTVVDAGNLTFVGTASLDGTISGGGALSFDKGTQRLGKGAALAVSTWNLTGRAQTTIAENLVYSGEMITDSGTVLTIDGKSKLSLGGLIDLAGTISGLGTLAFTGGNQTLESGARLETGGWDLGTGAATVIDESLVYAGSLVEAMSASIIINGPEIVTLQGTSILAGAIEGTGQLDLSGGSDILTGRVRLDISALTLKADVQASVDVDLTFAGTLNTSAGTTLSIADGKSLRLNGPVVGAGTIGIGAAAGLTVASASKSMTVAFSGDAGTLKLLDPADFKAGIAGYGAGDDLDLDTADFRYSKTETVGFTENAAGTGGTLTVKDGTHTLRLQLFGQFLAGGFALSADGHGGSSIIYAPPSSTLAVPITHGHG